MNYDLRTQNWRRRRLGQILILALVMLTVFTMLILSTYSKLTRFALFSRNTYQKELAVNLADGGIDYALSKLNANPSTDYNGTLNYSVLGKVTVTVATSGITKQITSIACIPDVAPNCRTQQKVVVQAATSGTAQTVSLQYAIEALGSGIDLSSTYVKGDVYTSGPLTTNGNTKVCGHVWSNPITTLIPPQLTFGCTNSWDGTSANPPPNKNSVTCPSTSCFTKLDPDIDYTLRKQSACQKVNPVDGNPSNPSGNYQQLSTCQAITNCTVTGPTNIGPAVYNCLSGLTINEGGGTVLVKGDIWVTGNLIISGLGTLRPDGTIYKSSNGKSPSIVIDGNLPDPAQIQQDNSNESTHQYLWLLGCQTSAQSMTLVSSPAVYYCPNSTVTVDQPYLSTQSTWVTVKVGPILAKGISFPITADPANFATVFGGSGLNTPTTFGDNNNSYWLIKRGTYLQKKEP